MPTTDLAADLHKQAEAATHGYATKSWLSRVVGEGTDEILGATICSEHAGESISELTVAIQSRIGLGALGRTIHPYPTVAEAIQGCGIGYNRTQWATMENNGRKKLEKLLGAVKPYAIGILGGLALAAVARRR